MISDQSLLLSTSILNDKQCSFQYVYVFCMYPYSYLYKVYSMCVYVRMCVCSGRGRCLNQVGLIIS